MALKLCEECGKEISSKARSCPHCGAARRKSGTVAHFVVACLGGIVGALLVVGMIAFQKTQGGFPPPFPKLRSGLAVPSLGGEVVTPEKFQHVENGMSYKEVAAIIGAEGEEISRGRTEGIGGAIPAIETVVYRWTNAAGGGMTVVFQNGLLAQKSQFGLR